MKNKFKDEVYFFKKDFIFLWIVLFLFFTIQNCLANSSSSSLAALQTDLNLIISNQNTTNQSLATANNALSSGVLTQDLKSSVEGWSGQSNTAKFIDYLDQLTSPTTTSDDKSQSEQSSYYINQFPYNPYYMSLIQGNYYSDESDGGVIPAGISTQANFLASAALSQINANDATNQSLLTSIQDQLSSDWLNGLKSSTRDQLLRSVSLQLSVSNLINYQQLQQQRIDSLLKVAELLDNKSLAKKIDKLSDIRQTLEKININLMKMNKILIKKNN
ncbi:hypothetical protein [Piscirickettsia salmonis]|uniref:hypothetical protein n=1 Tax=Piscirickettsia salmonis TaxID=1238 RepID=UPI0007D7F694|nr:hypothetical protein A0O36_00620 [Piscirickettsiaceae bacterium NZ-RLO1]